MDEPVASIEARAALFRAEMAALPNWSDTVVVCHWGFIMAMTGQNLQNGQHIRVDPTGPAPTSVPWKG